MSTGDDVPAKEAAGRLTIHDVPRLDTDEGAELRLAHLVLYEPPEVRARYLDAIRQADARLRRIEINPLWECVFTDHAHAVLQAADALHGSGRDVDPLSVRAWALRTWALREADIDVSLAAVEAAVPHRCPDRDLPMYLAKLARRRALEMRLADAAYASARGEDGQAAVYAAQAAELAAIDAPVEAAESREAPLMLGDLVHEAIDQARKRHAGDEKPIATPWATFNTQMRGGLWPGVHFLVSGTGVGKTTAALQIALTAAKAGTPCLYVGLEIDPLQIATRLIGEETWAVQGVGVAWSDLYVGVADPTAERVQCAAERLSRLPFYVERFAAHGYPPESLGVSVAHIRQSHPTGGLLVVLDFLQLVGNPEEGRPLEIRERIGRAGYAVREAATAHGASVLVVSSTARDKYNLVAGAAGDAGLSLDGSILRPDVLVGLGKESGEIEYAADSLTVMIAAGRRHTILATPKQRAGLPQWCVLVTNGYRFDDADDDGRAAAQRELAAAAQASEKTSNGKPRTGSKREPGVREQPSAKDFGG